MARSSSRRFRMRPSGRVVRRTGLGLAIGALGGWVAGLLRAPRSENRS